MNHNKTPEEIFADYERAQSYNTSLDLYETVKKNENFYIGKQWEGVIAPDLEKPVLNFLKRVVTYFVSMIVTDDVAVSAAPFEDTEENTASIKLLTDEVERVIEKTKAKALGRRILRDGAVDGDGCFYFFFDPDAQTGQDAKGKICLEAVDNTKILFGNPHIGEVQEQPYLIVVRREMVEQVRERAKKAGIEGEQNIQADSESSYYGEENNPDRNLVTVLTRFWKENGFVHYCECTRDCMLTPPTNTGYRLYPVAWFRWEEVKNSYHGQAAITGLIPNQIFVNKLWAMAMEHQKKMAFPRIFYDRTIIPEWTNRVGQAIGVSGDPSRAFATSFKAGDISSQVLELVDRTISYTKEFMGASDAALGNVKADNTSAIIALQKSSSAPLELQRLSFYQFVEDYVRIIIDMIRAKYGLRFVLTEGENGEKRRDLFDFSAIPYDAMDVNVDVGSSAYFSELMQIQTLDNLFSKGIISDAITYLEGIPDAYIRNKNKIIEKLRQQQAMKQTVMPNAEQLPPMEGGETDDLSTVQM